jgi:PncC family amidohydrolase
MMDLASDDISQNIAQLFIKKQLTISTAESCTGGMLAAEITALPGSSQYYLGSIIAYDNKIKAGLLGVPESLLEEYGAVSEEVGSEMAKCIVMLTGSDLGIGITGIAGPGGGSVNKPVGLVYIALYAHDFCICKRNVFIGDRTTVRLKSTRYAQHLIWDYLRGMHNA